MDQNFRRPNHEHVPKHHPHVNIVQILTSSAAAKARLRRPEMHSASAHSSCTHPSFRWVCGPLLGGSGASTPFRRLFLCLRLGARTSAAVECC